MKKDIFRPSPDTEVDEEIRFHLEMRIKELIEEGHSPEAARAMAEERFGPVRPVEATMLDSTRRRRRREYRAELLTHRKQDVHYALRGLRKNPGFAAAAIATLGLGVGAALAVFTVVNGVLLRPLPYREPDRVGMIWLTNTNPDGSTTDLPLSSGFYSDLENESRQFGRIAAFRGWSYSMSATDGTGQESISSARVSPALFEVLGVQPIMGSGFTPDDAAPGGRKAAVISHDLWARRFGSDQAIIGKVVSLSGESFTITGVMPPGFAFPRGAELPAGFRFALRTDLWTPLVFDSTARRNYGLQNLSVVGRLSAGTSRLSAESELNTIMKNFLAANAPQFKLGYHVVSLVEQAGRPVKRTLLILLGGVFCLLLIAIANVACLLVARVTHRQRELAVRAALGAGQRRIAGQLITENLVLATAGTVVGVLISFWATRVMLALVPGAMPRADDVGMDWRVILAAGLVALAGGVAFGLVASMSVSWNKLAGTLHSGDVRSTGGLRHRYGRRSLVALEVALSVILLIGAALLTRTFIALQRVPPGFNPNGVLTAGVTLPIAGRFNPTADGPAWSRKLNQIASDLSAAPGVLAAGAVSSLPLSGGLEGGGVEVIGEPPPPPGQSLSVQYNVVAGDYFAAVELRILAGRAFDRSDDELGRRGIIINREFAVQHFKTPANAVGREIRTRFDFIPNLPPRSIVGVVDDVKQIGLDEAPVSQIYVPESQLTYPSLVFVIRTRGDPLTAVTQVRKAAAAVDPLASVKEVRTMDDVVSESLARQRFSMTLIGIFAALALLLAIVGLYGVLSLLVGQRRREIGVRLALGAGRRHVVRLILKEGVGLATAGVILGIAGALILTRVLGALLYGVSTTDVMTFAGAGLIVAAVAIAATWIPARRAARVDPRTVLIAD